MKIFIRIGKQYVFMYDIENDSKFKKFLRAKATLSERTLQTYAYSMDVFCKYLNLSFSELVSNCLSEQNDKIDFENGIIIRFNKDTSKLADYIEDYVFYCRENGNKEKSIESKLRSIYAVLSYFNVETPTFPELKTNYYDWNVLDKKDIAYVLDMMSLGMKAVTTFLACTGERLGDALEWKIEDHMKNTYDYHKCTEIEDYLNKPFNEETIGFYEFKPRKTIRDNILCRHGVTNECCEYIFYSIKERFDKINQMVENGELERGLRKSDYLFASSRNLYGKRSGQGVRTLYLIYNDKFQKHQKSILKQKLESNIISKETYDLDVKTIPRFHAHGLRKWFISTVRANCSNLSVCVQMEGHTLPVSTDKSYVQLDKELIKSEYFKIIPELSFNNTDVKVLTSDKIKYYEDELNKQKKINQQYNEKFKKLEKLESFIKGLDDFDFDKF